MFLHKKTKKQHKNGKVSILLWHSREMLLFIKTGEMDSIFILCRFTLPLNCVTRQVRWQHEQFNLPRQFISAFGFWLNHLLTINGHSSVTTAAHQLPKQSQEDS